MGVRVCEDEQKVKNTDLDVPNQVVKSPSRQKLESWLNRNMRIEMTDGRTLVGIFLCTDRERNVILGSCAEYLQLSEGEGIPEEEPRVLGLAMVPGHYIVSIQVDASQDTQVL